MTRDEIYECIPEATREAYGSNRDEQIDNFMKENPDIFGEVLKTEQDILDYIVVTLANKLGVCDMAFKGGYILNQRIPGVRQTYDIAGVDANVFTIERSLSDKLSVLCSRKRFRRVKDLYDIYVQTLYFNIDYMKLQEALEKRETTWNLFPSDDVVLEQLRHAYETLVISDTDSERVKPPFKEVMERISIFCDPMLYNYEKSTWDCKRGGWL